PERIDSEFDFRIFCERAPVGAWIIQGDCVRYANPALAELLGRELGMIVGTSPLAFIHPDDGSNVEEQIRRRIDGEAETDPFEMRLVRSNGEIVDVEVLESRIDNEGQTSLMGTLVDITARKRAEMDIKDRLGFERLLADLSAAFINLPADEIDGQIDASLKHLVEYLGNDRSTFVEFGDDETHVLVTHSYSIAGCEGFPIGKFPTERLPWFIGQFRSGTTVFVRNVAEDLPSEAATELKYCQKLGIKSNVTVPLRAGGQVLGGLTFAFMREHCEWPGETISRLNLVGEVFANALSRRRTERSLRLALTENENLRNQLEQENVYLREQAVLKHNHGRIIGRSDAITQVLADVERVATTDAPVLLIGETGTGKELLAHAIHDLSSRKRRPMVIVNCASLPATLVESELFGRMAGAYTGAASAQIGRFELADKSTLFLDEMGELPLELQAKLLRVLQDGRFERLGSSKTIAVNVRIIAATNRDLEQAVRDGRFRADLFHRLNVFPIRIPPLRQRREDIPPLVWTFVEAFGRRMGKVIKNIPRKMMQQLQEYHWPGNVRELSNVIERAMILTDDETLRVELPITKQEGASVARTLKETEREEILRVLQQTGWRIRGVGGAAQLLDIKPTTLEARMVKLGVRRPNKLTDCP
ncbi:MAG: sigma 54-interacting transcriptional regulator, partial [Pirellulaceae bacterium]